MVWGSLISAQVRVARLFLCLAIDPISQAHHNYVPTKLESMAGASSMNLIGKANVPLTARPQPRGALVIGSELEAAHEGSEVTLVVSRLKARGWEVVLVRLPRLELVFRGSCRCMDLFAFVAGVVAVA